ncbi:MAG: hypothetical protein ACK5WS_07370 [Alphaproteobacteria bacterium]|jgi:hypothetical protein|nr:hypothetical protein [Candidatus Jidaibacter sp.]
MKKFLLSVAGVSLAASAFAYAQKTAVRPEDVLSDSQNTTVVDGLTVRKGSVAAFLRNIEVLEDKQSSAEQSAAALNIIKELSPAIVAVGLHKHAEFKNKQVEAILVEAEKK